MAPWKLPLVVLAIAVPIAAGFLFAGPGAGFGVGALAAAAIIVIAVNQRPRGPIGVEPAPGEGRRALIVVSWPVEDPAAVREIVAALGDGAGEAGAGGLQEDPQVMVLAPARIGFLDRWASDVEKARRDAQRNLVITVASLAKAGIEAEARVGDEDVVQAVEDQLGSFPATQVILASGDAEADPHAAAAARELRERLRPEFRHLPIAPGA